MTLKFLYEAKEKIKNYERSLLSTRQTRQNRKKKIDEENLNFLGERDRHKLYSKLAGLSFFEGYTQEEILYVFTRASLLKYKESTEIEFSTKKKDYFIILRGKAIAHNQKIITSLENLDPNNPEARLKRLDEQYLIEHKKNLELMYQSYSFTLGDGEYLSPNISTFYKYDATRRTILRFAEDTTVLQFEDIGEFNFIEKYKNFDFFTKLDYLCRHELFSYLSIFTLQTLARSAKASNYLYGDRIVKVGDSCSELTIITEGKCSVIFEPVSIQIKKKKQSSEWEKKKKVLNGARDAKMYKELLLLNCEDYDVPMSCFRKDSMVIEYLFEGEVFGGFFLLKEWEKYLCRKVKVEPHFTYSVSVESSRAWAYSIPRESLQDILGFDRVRNIFMDRGNFWRL